MEHRSTIWGVVTQRIIARRTTTVQHISNLLNDHDYIKARKQFIEIATSDTKLLPYAKEDCDDHDGEAAIDLVLNNYELIAIGIQRGILDYKTVRRYARAIIIKHYDAAAPYIERLRAESKNPQYYEEFQTMRNWMSDNKVKPKGRFLSLFF